MQTPETLLNHSTRGAEASCLSSCLQSFNDWDYLAFPCPALPCPAMSLHSTTPMPLLGRVAGHSNDFCANTEGSVPSSAPRTDDLTAFHLFTQFLPRYFCFASESAEHRPP